MEQVDPDFLEILCCPISRKPLRLEGDWLISTDEKTRRRYPIRDGIPVLMKNESEEMELEHWIAAMQKSSRE